MKDSFLHFRAACSHSFCGQCRLQLLPSNRSMFLCPMDGIESWAEKMYKDLNVWTTVKDFRYFKLSTSSLHRWLIPVFILIIIWWNSGIYQWSITILWIQCYVKCVNLSQGSMQLFSSWMRISRHFRGIRQGEIALTALCILSVHYNRNEYGHR